MFFIDQLEIEKRIRVMRREFEKFGISDELRGYSWDSPPVEPINNKTLSVSDFIRICPTMRDLYLKYVEKLRLKPNVFMLSGLAYHEVISKTIFEIKKILYQESIDGAKLIELMLSNLEIPVNVCKKLDIDAENCIKLYKFLVIQTAAQIDRVLSKFPFASVESVISKALPPIVERQIDGSLVGLSSNLSVDIFTPYNVIADLKSGEEREQNFLTLAGYALALEADESTDVNFGFIIYLRFGKFVQFKIKHSLISDELRRQFLELRDEALDLIESEKDPGKAESCPKYCGFYGVCNETDS